jgi:glyoxylase-like metal-dependent hydrolase (beta-lactamase superfamily II)
MSAIATWVVAVSQAAAATASPPVAPPPQAVAPGVELLRGAILPQRGPDGNTIVFDAPGGLVVVDTGRHDWHSDAILTLARERKRPVVAILNTHWHLDHSSGNGRIKAAFPDAPVYTTGAVDRVLAEDGFLARNLESSKAMLDDPKLSDTQREEVRIFMATMAESDVLRPDVVVKASGAQAIGGRGFDVHVTDGAVTDADLWLYDGPSGIAVIGDLVTLPAPFFETACPAEWRKALDAVWATPFTLAIPGHGEPMTRAGFDSYRASFNAFMDCVEGSSEPAQCAASWADGIAPLVGSDDGALKNARGYAEYYVGMLRENGGKSADCLSR